jgi:hypothetical protein
MVPVRTATQDQREMAALLYADRHSLLTGAGRVGQPSLAAVPRAA